MSTRSPSSVHWNATQYDAKHTYVPRFGEDVLKLLAPRPGERILDLGCGTGRLTAQIAAAGTRVVGLDASEEMVRQARAQYPDLQLVVADGARFAFARPFDAVFSNAAIHWMGAARQDDVAASVAQALVDGGRFVAEFGGKGNVARLTEAMRAGLRDLGIAATEDPSPWYFPTVGEYATVLERHGLEVASAELFDRPTPLDAGENGIREWIAMFGADFAARVPPDRLDDFVRVVEDRLRPTMFRDGTWSADYRRLRVVALKAS